MTLRLASPPELVGMQLPDENSHKIGKILDHGAGIGEASEDMVEERARELAMIARLTPDQVTHDYRRQAREELLGFHDPNSEPADEDGIIADLSRYNDVPGESGQTVNTSNNPMVNGGEETVGEQLYAEGIAEATHDQMVESRKGERSDSEADNSVG